MRPRPDMTSILGVTSENIVTGKRNPRSAKNTAFYFTTDITTFSKFVEEAGIKENFNDLGVKSSIKFKVDNSVTRFLAKQWELGNLSDSLLQYVYSFESHHYTDLEDVKSAENTTYRAYVEEIIA